MITVLATGQVLLGNFNPRVGGGQRVNSVLSIEATVKKQAHKL